MNKGKMSIKQYQGYFHDGTLIGIEHQQNQNTIILEMASAEVDPQDIKIPTKVGKISRIIGKLHLEEVKSVLVNGSKYSVF